MSFHNCNTKSLDESQTYSLKHLKHFPKLKPNLTETSNISTIINNLKKTKNRLNNDSSPKLPVDNPFDSLATAIVTSSVNYLIKKSTVKEKSASFEKNNLCKLHYPLIYFISNRKTSNNSKKLMENLINTDNAEITKMPKLPKTVINQTLSPLNRTKKIKFNNYSDCLKKNDFNNRYSLSNEKYNKISASLKLSINNTTNNSINQQSEQNNFKLYTPLSNKKDFYRTNNYNKKLRRENRLFCLKNFYNNDRSYLLGNESVNLFNHRTNEKNKDILHTKYYRMRSCLKNELRDNNFKTIIKDISLLKSNNRIMPLQIDENYY